MQLTGFGMMYDTDLLKQVTNNRTLSFRKDLDEVFLLAEGTPSLANSLPLIDDVINWFDRAFKSNANTNEMNGYWFDFVNMVLQRYAVLFEVELSAADKLVKNLFQRFFNSRSLKGIRMSYRYDVAPVVFLGRGGTRSYYTLPPTLHRPLAIIHLPRAALNNVWRWNVLAHETGHDVFFCVENLAREMEALAATVAVDALRAGKADYPPISTVLKINGRLTPIEMTREQFTVSLWSKWTNELFADLFAILMCGPSTVFTMQEMIGFGSVGSWHGVQGPDPHPLPVLRNLINITFMRQLGFSYHAHIIERRMLRHNPNIRDAKWVFNGVTEVTRIKLGQLMPMIELITTAMLNYPLQSLNNHSLREVINFNFYDQAMVDALVDAAAGDTIPPQGAEPRHVVAAAQLAFVFNPYQADKIHNNLINFLSQLNHDEVYQH